MLISHRTSYHFPEGASRLLLLLRLWPEPHSALVVRRWQVTVNDIPVSAGARTGHGDRMALWSAAASPGDVVITASGVVESDDKAGLVTGLTVRPNPAIFLRPTDRTRPDKAIRDLVSAPAKGADLIPWLHALMQAVHDALPYVSGSTTVHTTAAEALKDKAGVCQDHAHLFISAARLHGVPARYVCGYMLADAGQGDLHETHAWAEAWVDGLGWVAFDPSANLSPTERYVRLCTGLDALDAAPIRGHAVGGVALGVIADVRIARTEAGSSSDEERIEARLRAQQVQNQQQQQQQQ
jgi:transglutaminase-like putative cysteine protease